MKLTNVFLRKKRNYLLIFFKCEAISQSQFLSAFISTHAQSNCFKIMALNATGTKIEIVNTYFMALNFDKAWVLQCFCDLELFHFCKREFGHICQREKLLPRSMGNVKPGFHIFAGIARIAKKSVERSQRFYGNQI